MTKQRNTLNHLKDKLGPTSENDISNEADEFLGRKPRLLDDTPVKIKYTHVTYSVPETVKEGIKKLAKELDMPQSTIVSKALEHILEQYRDKL